jgi:hypothetical protein
MDGGRDDSVFLVVWFRVAMTVGQEISTDTSHIHTMAGIGILENHQRFQGRTMLAQSRLPQIPTNSRIPRIRGARTGPLNRVAAANEDPVHPSQIYTVISRTNLLRQTLIAAAGLAATAVPSAAFTPPPPGYNFHEDKLDGYSFLYPSDWIPVTTSGNDVFFRNSFNSEENLFVDVTSPSSSKYSSIEDIGTPEEAAGKLRVEFLDEFLSTRLGVKREAEVVKASRRTGNDGKLYYDIQIRMTSYASTNQLAVTQAEIDGAIVKEFDRYYLTTLGVGNSRLYSLRVQTSVAAFDTDSDRLERIGKSFVCKEV